MAMGRMYNKRHTARCNIYLNSSFFIDKIGLIISFILPRFRSLKFPGFSFPEVLSCLYGHAVPLAYNTKDLVRALSSYGVTLTKTYLSNDINIEVQLHV